MTLPVRFKVASPGSEARDLFDVLVVLPDTVVAIETFLGGVVVGKVLCGKYSLMVYS